MRASRVFISYSHDSSGHEDRVLELSNRLRSEGLDCVIDQYEQSPPEGWPKWCERQVEGAEFILVICTETYQRRFRGEETEGRGLGGTWEGHIITQDLYDAQGKNSKFIPVTFSLEELRFIPRLLKSATHYLLDQDYDLLYRRLTDQPFTRKPEIGSVVAMPVRKLPPQPSRKRQQESASIWHVRHRRNSLFTGREQTLAELRKALEERGSAALSGLGGMGKTQTAIEYAYQYRSEYSAVFWAKAESRETLVGSFVSIAAALQLDSAQAPDQAQTVADVKNWLEANSGWLLILDNADELAVIQSLLPNQGSGHMLFTTQARAGGSLAEFVPVRYMPPEDGALLLLRRAGVIAKDGRLSDATEADRQLALQISKELGGLPLALDQAGAFIEETPSTLSEYAEFYACQKSSLLAERGTSGDHASSVTVTFSLAFAKIAAVSPAAAELVRLCAFLASDAIPEEIFTAGEASCLGEALCHSVRNRLQFAETIRVASRYSLIDRDATNRTLGIHQLVQLVVRAGMPEADQKIWAERAIRLTAKAFPDVEFANWKLCQKLIAHSQVCANWVRYWGFAFAEAAELLNQTAVYLAERALYAQAEPLHQLSIAILERTVGPEHPDFAISLNNLARLYNNQGKYPEAEALHKRSLAILERTVGPEHPYLATSLNNLASLYDNQGKYAEAELLHRRSLAFKEKALGPNDPAVARSLNNLAELYRKQGKYAEAEPLYKRSLEIRENAFGPGDPAVARSLNNLAELYRSQGKYADAEPLCKRSLEIREETLGPTHPDVAKSLDSLAELYRVQGKYIDAEPLYKRSLEIVEAVLGPEHPDVAAILNNVAELYQGQGKYDKAEAFFKRSLKIREKVLGSSHPDVVVSLSHIADVYRSQGRYAEAKPLYDRAFEIRQKAEAGKPDAAAGPHTVTAS
ncbi:MAG TPA: FxSxx-COOH system tetratricopeptide repeat protein [Bryobacteraceae bacterium]|nr:FxSxx-COOH system tetratricopeptide repeat protein [Bryobacteraceae bacterium]